jgi:putative ABC transport system substrate-binding protein
MNSKIVILLLSALLFALCTSTLAQQPEKIFRIGVLEPSTASAVEDFLDTFRQELSRLGWIEGKNITIEYRFAERKLDRLPELAAELVRQKVDLIVVGTGQAPSVAKKATSTIPIVMRTSVDPVGAGLIASLARPGGNITGLSGLSPELNTKRLEILKDAIPKLSRVGFLLTELATVSVTGDLLLKELRAAALGLKLKLDEIKTEPDAKSLGSAFQTAKQKQADAVIVAPGSRMFAERKRIVELAGKHRLPATRGMSMRAGLCSTGWTPLISIAVPLVTLTKS